MKRIEQIEKRLPQKRKALLHSLRASHWEVVSVDDDDADWALEQRWVVESTRENKGATLALWFFKYEGVHDGMNNVVATAPGAPPPSAYFGRPGIDFDKRGFEKQLGVFMASLDRFRFDGTLEVSDGDSNSGA